MRTLLLLALCCIIRISTGAILTEEMTMLNNQILENIKTSGIRNVPNVLTKNDEVLKNGNVAEKIMKDIDHLLSSLQIGEYDGNDNNSYNVSVGSTCNWSENSFKCCQAFDLTGNTCLVAKFVGDDINLFVQVGDKMMLIKTMSYKKTMENMFQDASKLITGNAEVDEDIDVDDFDQENILDDEESKILSEEEATNDNISVDDTRRRIHCTWGRRTGGCCGVARVFDRDIRYCVKMTILRRSRVFFYAKIGGFIIWRKTANICSKRIGACHKFGPLYLCLVIEKLRVSRNNVKGCAYAYGKVAWLKKKYKLFCFNKWHRLSDIPEILKEEDPFDNY